MAMISVLATSLVASPIIATSPALAEGLGTEISSSVIQDEDDNYVPSKKCAPVDSKDTAGESDGQDDSAPSSGDDAGGVDAWKTKGTIENKTAQQIYDTFTKEHGTSGAFAVGQITNAIFESGLIPDRSQGAGTIRFGMNSKTPPANEGGGGGLWQFTPYSKFTESSYWGKNGGDGWAVANQADYMFDTEFRTGTAWIYASSTNPTHGAAYYGRSPAFGSLKEWLTTSDPTKATEAFQVGYERPAVFHPERLAKAKEVNDYFNKDNKKADTAKIDKLVAGSQSDSSDFSDVSDASSSESSATGQEDSVDCATVQSNEDSEGGAISEEASGESGLSVGDSWGKPFKYNELPDNLKKYAIDPTSIGVQYNNCANWTQWTNTSDPFLNGQCVALSKSFFNEYWQKDGHSPKPWLCDGYVCADNASSANGASASRTPTTGAVAQQKSPGPVGHTYIVSHVFKNGDILILEQNMAGFSGAQNGQSCTWNWRVQSKAGYESFDTSFYAPTKQGYKPNSKAKTLGK